MSSTIPLISILIPAWNRPDELTRLVERINSSKHDDLEIIIVDDNSLEKNAKKFQELASMHSNVRLFRNEKNVGMTNNWNKTIEYAKGTWLGFICDDDIYKEDALDRVRAIISKTKEPCLILQNFQIEQEQEWLEKGIETTNKLELPPASGQFWHREMTDRLGGFDNRIKYCPDDEFWIRLAFHYPVLRVKNFFVIPFQHSTNYMWQIFKEPDFIEQVTLSIKTRSKYTLGNEYDKKIAFAIDDGLWETLRTVINNTFLVKGNMKRFPFYFITFIKLSVKMKRVSIMLKVLIRLVAVKLYQPIKPLLKKSTVYR
jgi:glycosyltransferase involved in cell wall biosynthesis